MSRQHCWSTVSLGTNLEKFPRGNHPMVPCASERALPRAQLFSFAAALLSRNLRAIFGQARSEAFGSLQTTGSRVARRCDRFVEEARQGFTRYQPGIRVGCTQMRRRGRSSVLESSASAAFGHGPGAQFGPREANRTPGNQLKRQTNQTAKAPKTRLACAVCFWSLRLAATPSCQKSPAVPPGSERNGRTAAEPNRRQVLLLPLHGAPGAAGVPTPHGSIGRVWFWVFGLGGLESSLCKKELGVHIWVASWLGWLGSGWVVWVGCLLPP